MKVGGKTPRFVLVALVVLAAAATPLAYAATFGKTTAGTGEVPAAALTASPASPQVTGGTMATADRPIQKVVNGSTTAGSTCQIVGFPANPPPFVLTRVSVFTLAGTASSASLQVQVKASDGSLLQDDISIPLGSDGDGDRNFDILVHPNNSFANAAPGDVRQLSVCFNNASQGSNLEYLAIVTGELTASPTAAPAVAAFQAGRATTGWVLRWTTAAETNVFGFNIWRYWKGKATKLNRTLLSATRSGEPTGASYRFVDHRPRSKTGYTYRLQLVDLEGRRSWYPAFAVASS